MTDNMSLNINKDISLYNATNNKQNIYDNMILNNNKTLQCIINDTSQNIYNIASYSYYFNN